eukprot:1668109-Pleurochrysis_carterae.AAC.1
MEQSAVQSIMEGIVARENRGGERVTRSHSGAGARKKRASMTEARLSQRVVAARPTLISVERRLIFEQIGTDERHVENETEGEQVDRRGRSAGPRQPARTACTCAGTRAQRPLRRWLANRTKLSIKGSSKIQAATVTSPTTINAPARLETVTSALCMHCARCAQAIRQHAEHDGRGAEGHVQHQRYEGPSTKRPLPARGRQRFVALVSRAIDGLMEPAANCLAATRRRRRWRRRVEIRVARRLRRGWHSDDGLSGRLCGRRRGERGVLALILS